MKLCLSVSVSFICCIGISGSGKMGDRDKYTRLGSGIGECILGAVSVSMLWCPCIFSWLDTGVAVNGLVRPLCCPGVVMVVVVFVILLGV